MTIQQLLRFLSLRAEVSSQKTQSGAGALDPSPRLPVNPGDAHKAAGFAEHTLRDSDIRTIQVDRRRFLSKGSAFVVGATAFAIAACKASDAKTADNGRSVSDSDPSDPARYVYDSDSNDSD